MATLEEFQRAARYGRIIIRGHAQDRCDERGANERHVKAAILSATTCTPEEEGKHLIEGGKDLHDDGLSVVARLHGHVGLLIVTVFGEREGRR